MVYIEYSFVFKLWKNFFVKGVRQQHGDMQLKNLKDAIIELEMTDNYYEVKNIIDKICNNLDCFRNFLLIIKLKRAKRKLRQGFLGRLDNSRCEVGKIICEMEKTINSIQKGDKNFF